MYINTINTMKKLFCIVIVAILASSNLHAQFTNWGVRGALGAACFADDLVLKSPIMAANLGAYVNYGFTDASAFWADNLYLQFGANFIRRGANIQQVFELQQSLRTSYYHNYSFQIPVLVGWRWELPVKVPNRFLNFYVGPQFTVGMFGKRWDRWVSPGLPQTAVNYDSHITGDKLDRRSFQHMRRFDGGLILGVGYHFDNFTLDFMWEHGFVPVMHEDEVLSSLSIALNGGSTDLPVVNPDGSVTHTTLDQRNGYTGTNQTFLIALGYNLPIK